MIDLLAGYRRRLEAIPFVRRVKWCPEPTGRRDGAVRIETPAGDFELIAELKSRRLSKEMIHGLVVRWTDSAARVSESGGRDRILLTPHVGRAHGQLLDREGINFVDLAGNHRLHLAPGYFARVEGRPSVELAPRGRGVGVAGYRIYLALLIQPALLRGSQEALARVAEVHASTVSIRLRRMEEEGLVHRTESGRVVADREELLEHWLEGYRRVARSRLMLGKFRARETDPDEFAARGERELGDLLPWALGGAAGADRLTGYYRSGLTVIHGDSSLESVPHRLGLLRDERGGNVLLIRAPFAAALQGPRAHVAHPILLYGELLAHSDKRHHEAAAELRRAFPEAFGRDA